MLLPGALLLVSTCGAGRVTRQTTARDEGLQGDVTTQLVITDGATAICDLEIGIAASKISSALVNCVYPNSLDTNSYFGWRTEGKTFYDKIGEEVYHIDLTTRIYIGEPNHPLSLVNTLNLKLTPSCDIDNTELTNTTMSYTSTSTDNHQSSSFSSAGSMASSNPEGFILAFVQSSSSFDDATVETSVSSGGSVQSSVPEGFVFAFGDPSASSSASVASSTPEGFVFAFTASSKAQFKSSKAH